MACSSFLLPFPFSYPLSEPSVTAIYSVVDNTVKGLGRVQEKKLAKALSEVWTQGQECLFDLIETAQAKIEEAAETSSVDTVQSTITGDTVIDARINTVPSTDNSATSMYAALIRTPHITSRKNVATLKAAAKKLGCAALLRSGASPGMMYCEGQQDNVQEWVDTVHGLRNEDYQLIGPSLQLNAKVVKAGMFDFEEVASVKEFGAKMEQKGNTEWFPQVDGLRVRLNDL